MLEELYSKAKEDDADMVICDYYENNEYLSRRKHGIPSHVSFLASERVLWELIVNEYGCFLWNKLIRSNCYNDYNVAFINGIDVCEDSILLSQLLHLDVRISYTPIALYHYDRSINSNAITKDKSYDVYKKNLAIIDAYKQLASTDKCPSFIVLYSQIYACITLLYIGGISSIEYANIVDCITISDICNSRIKLVQKALIGVSKLNYSFSHNTYHYLIQSWLFIKRRCLHLY
jgi:hypothetical protein